MVNEDSNSFTSLKSSSLSGFRKNGGNLEVKFPNGKVYTYYNVPDKIISEMQSSESSGKFFHKNIAHVYNKVDK